MEQLTAIGARIKQARLALGWTQSGLAQAIGVSRSAVAQWETGRAGQVTANLAQVAAVLDVGLDHLLYGADKQAPMTAATGDELALLRLYRSCAPADRQWLLRTARNMAKGVDAKK